MRKFGYVIVEGPHDVEFTYRLLRPFNLKRVCRESSLDPFFRDLVPRAFPHGGDLQKRVPVPLFLQSDTHAIAIHNATGDSRLAAAVEESAAVIKFNDLTGVGIILDCDSGRSADSRYQLLRRELSNKGYLLPESAGMISNGTPKIGAFVLPDNCAQGNLEDILIECANAAFPNLLISARQHVETAKNDSTFVDNHREDLSDRSRYNKAVVGAIAATLRPGRAVQTSIQDNIWLKGNNLEIPRVKAIQSFLVELLDLQ